MQVKRLAFGLDLIRRVDEVEIVVGFSVNTHMHADHITGTGKLKTLLPECRSMISRSSGAKADILLEAEDNIEFGRHRIAVLPTPGHTEGESLGI